MWVVRAAKAEDTDAVLKLAASLGPGMTTFPPDREVLAAKVDAAVRSFSGELSGSAAEYLLVLEDEESEQLLGVSAVYPSIGEPYGFFSYHVNRIIMHSPVTDYQVDCRMLDMSNAYTGLTEIGTLAVSPDLRRGGAGKILARARYLLMACFPHLFADHVIAEMRGWQESDGTSPFWDAIGRQFFRTDFPSADTISAVKGAEWIADLMPKFPIYVDLLPPEAQECIGKPHQTSAIAMRMLLKEGFRFEDYVDVFDAGPQVIAPLGDIQTVRESSEAEPVIGDVNDPHSEHLVCSTDLQNFRLTKTLCHVEDDQPHLSQEAYRALRLDQGKPVRFVEHW